MGRPGTALHLCCGQDQGLHNIRFYVAPGCGQDQEYNIKFDTVLPPGFGCGQLLPASAKPVQHQI